jgi:hypothetical protein
MCALGTLVAAVRTLDDPCKKVNVVVHPTALVLTIIALLSELHDNLHGRLGLSRQLYAVKHILSGCFLLTRSTQATSLPRSLKPSLLTERNCFSQCMADHTRQNVPGEIVVH